MTVKTIIGDCRIILRDLPAQSVNCCVTSPPYWGLRDYGNEAQIGLEQSIDGFVAELVNVFREVRRVLRDDGTLWLNLGDTYSGGGNYRGITDSNVLSSKQASNRGATGLSQKCGALGKESGAKPKDLIGVPWQVAFALRADGWYLRQDIIWAKPNPMPESVTDRCTKSHEYIFLLSKKPSYYFDADAIAEDAIYSGLTGQDETGYKDAKLFDGKHSDVTKRSARDSFKRDNSKRGVPIPGQSVGTHRPDRAESQYDTATRNKRDVWTVPTKPFSEAHFATFPPALIEPCILAGCPVGGTVLDPFGGAGTTGLVSDRLQRNAILIELNPEYATIADNRIYDDAPLLTCV